MEQILEIIAKMVEAGESGEVALTEVVYNINQTMDELKKAKEQVEDGAFDEFYRNKEGNEATIDGHKVTFRNGGFSWDFKGVDKWQEMDAMKKAFEKKCKALFEHSNCIDVETGEELEILRKPRKDSLIIKKV